MSGYLYVGEASGARIIRVGTGYTQVTADGTEDVNLELETQDLLPGGEVGDCVFRAIDVAGYATNGYAIQITPVIDGEALTPQAFSGGGAGAWTAQAFIAERGTRVSAIIASTARTGELEVSQVSCEAVVLRTSP